MIKVNLEENKKLVVDLLTILKEVFVLLFGVVVIAGGIYALLEGKNVLEGVWWATITTFTVGYGDAIPATTGGKVIAGLLLTLSVFVVVPLITAKIIVKATEKPKPKPRKKPAKKAKKK
jgi:hypothetical protein